MVYETGFGLMIEFIGPLYNWLQQFTNPNLRLDSLDFWPHYSSNWTVTQSNSQSYFTTGGLQPISSSWQQAPWDSRPVFSFFINWTLAVIVLMQHPLWREDESVVYNCCWSSPAQSFSSRSPAGLMTIFCCLRFETPPDWRARSSHLYPPRDKMAQLYPQKLGYLFVASYDSQGYGGGIRPSGRTTQKTHQLPSNGCSLVLRIRCRGMCLLARCLAMALCVTIYLSLFGKF
jgi:hypothetical protein